MCSRTELMWEKLMTEILSAGKKPERCTAAIFSLCSAFTSFFFLSANISFYIQSFVSVFPSFLKPTLSPELFSLFPNFRSCFFFSPHPVFSFSFGSFSSPHLFSPSKVLLPAPAPLHLNPPSSSCSSSSVCTLTGASRVNYLLQLHTVTV